MFIIDFQEHAIKEVDADGICMFVNELIRTKDDDLLGKRYLFVPDADAAEYIITRSMEELNGAKH